MASIRSPVINDRSVKDCYFFHRNGCRHGSHCRFNHLIKAHSVHGNMVRIIKEQINGRMNVMDYKLNQLINAVQSIPQNKTTAAVLQQNNELKRNESNETERKKIICVNPYENELTLLKKKLKNTEMRLRNAVLRINQDKASEQRNYNKQETERNYEKQPRNHNEAELSEHTQPRNYAKLVNEMKDINKRLEYKWHELNKQLTTNKYFLRQIRSHQRDIDHQEKVIYNGLKAFFDEENDAGNDEDENKIIRNTRYVGSDQQKALDDMLLSEQHDESPKDSDEEMEKWKKLIASEIRNDELIYSEQLKPRNEEDDGPKLTHIPNVYATKELTTVDPVAARKKDLEEREMWDNRLKFDDHLGRRNNMNEEELARYVAKNREESKKRALEDALCSDAEMEKWIKEMKNSDNDDNKDNDDEHCEESECIEYDKDCIDHDKDDYKEENE